MDTIIIGGGIVGLATAYKILLRRPAAKIAILEKESDVGRHQSTHNSGVLHAGLHYSPGSVKARLARAGIREMVEFCSANGIPHEQCGKLVVATSPQEEERLKALAERGTRNGLRALRWLTRGEMLEIEPNVAGTAALHVPEEGIVDYAAVCATLKRLIGERGGEVVLNARVRKLTRQGSEWIVETDANEYRAAMIVNCGGLHSDRVARMAGERPESQVVPFRGEYWLLANGRSNLVRNLIYPVPDPTFPFLGVHFTRLIRGGVEAGPNAVLALAREGYRWTHLNIRDLAQSLAFPGLWRFIAKYPRVATYEVARSLLKQLFVRSLQRLVPAVNEEDLVRGEAGVRAQVMTRDGSLVQDFEILVRRDAVHVLNAPSPAATASLAIATHIVELIEAR